MTCVNAIQIVAPAAASLAALMKLMEVNAPDLISCEVNGLRLGDEQRHRKCRPGTPMAATALCERPNEQTDDRTDRVQVI
jgi:hypothetical protein